MSNIYKEYLSEEEAAEYMCLGKSTFNEHKKDWGIVPYRLPGIAKNVYKRDDLRSVLEGKLSLWQPSSNEESTGTSNGQMDRDSIEKALKNMALQQNPKRKTTNTRRN